MDGARSQEEEEQIEKEMEKEEMKRGIMSMTSHSEVLLNIILITATLLDKQTSLQS